MSARGGVCFSSSQEMYRLLSPTCGTARVRRYVVVDEGHRLKNSKCKLITLLRTIPASQKLLLTGAAG